MQVFKIIAGTAIVTTVLLAKFFWVVFYRYIPEFFGNATIKLFKVNEGRG